MLQCMLPKHLLLVLFRCIDALYHGVNAYKDKTKILQARALIAFRDNSLLNLYASILEDAPQVILQIYIMKASGKSAKISEGDHIIMNNSLYR